MFALASRSVILGLLLYGGNMNQYFLLFKSIEFQVMTK